ncbi:MAG: amino acid racemase [Anaerolineales bacterium]
MTKSKQATNNAKHIGIVACSAAGSAFYYKTVCAEATQVMGEHMHPEITMHTYPLGMYEGFISSGNWAEVANLMLSSVKKLALAGADFAVCPDNTIHQAFDLVVKESPIPWLHIAKIVAKEAKSLGYKKLAVLGTKNLMTGPVYSEQLKKSGISFEIPDKEDRETLNQIVFNELAKGTFTEPSRLYLNKLIQELKDRGCDGAALACMELPMLVDPADCPLPTLDPTTLLAKAAIKEALEV